MPEVERYLIPGLNLLNDVANLLFTAFTSSCMFVVALPAFKLRS